MVYSPVRLVLAAVLVGAYLLYWANYGSPLMAFSSWMGWIDTPPATGR